MTSPRHRIGTRAVALLVAVATGSSCAVASLFFDIPQKPPAQPAQATSSVPTPVSQSLAGDPARPAIERTTRSDSALALLPRDGAGNVDWVSALRDGVIRPRRAPPGTAAPPDMSGFLFDFRFKGPNEMFDALFPHSAHVQWLDCRSCHPAIFPYRGEPITMASINEGEACGRCHGPVAFPVTTCGRCHTAMGVSGDNEPVFTHDVVLARRADTSSASGQQQFPQARFAHWVHRIRYRCMACHPGLFQLQAGADTLTMGEIRRGAACGACHNGREAFGLLECNRCHVAQQGSEGSQP